jgi:D-3-phosphoglycerate dehydrogenase
MKINTKVVVTQPIHEEGMRILNSAVEEVVVAPDDSLETIARLLDDGVEGVVVRYNPFPKELIDKAPNLKVIARHGIGVELIDVKYATEKGIYVVNTPMAATVSVAEHTIALMIALAKKLLKSDSAVRNDNYSVKSKLGCTDLAHKTLGIVGAGKIGIEVAKKCKLGFDMDVIAFDPYVNKEIAEKLGIEVVDALEDLLERADYVSLHVPLSKETKHMLSIKEFKKMKKTAFLINCGRGALVNEEDLITALSSGEIAGAGLDVFEKEPPEKDNPLLKMEQVVLTPHSASLTYESMVRMATGAASQLVQVLKGEKPEFIVNKELSK